MTILVTGACGMIGSKLTVSLLHAGYTVVGVDRTGSGIVDDSYSHYAIDLADSIAVDNVFKEHHIDRIVHLAALAHTTNEKDLSWERYKQVNVDCAKNLFAVVGDRPVLFISTVDVYGFYDGKRPVNANTELHPVSKYGKSKAMAEDECRKLKQYTIFRFSPVYSDTMKRDIQKRYYLKYPSIAYRIGRGNEYEVLNIDRAVKAMLDWCSDEIRNDTCIIKDQKNMKVCECIRTEQQEQRAKVVLYFPVWLIKLGYFFLRSIFGENEKVYLLNKAVHPLRSE